MNKTTITYGDVEIENWRSPRIVAVYLDDSRVFEYEVDDATKAREFAVAIGQKGLRALYYDGSHQLTWEFYGPLRINKIKVTPAIASNYTGQFRGEKGT